MILGYWAVDLDEDVHFFETAEAARAAAEAALDEARAESYTGDGWPETTRAIRWGEVDVGGQRVLRGRARFRVEHEHTLACRPESDPDDEDGDDPDECAEGYGMGCDRWGKYELIAIGGGAR